MLLYSNLLVVKGNKLNDHTCDWHEVVVVNQVKVIDQSVEKVDYDIPERLLVVWLLSFILKSPSDLF